MDMFKFQCGDLVKDKITGSGGIVVVRAEYVSGNVFYGVKPKKPVSGKPDEAFWLDEDALVMVKKTKEKRPARAFKFNLGDEVKDRHTDLAGVISSRSDHMYGCLRYQVQPRALKDGKPVDSTGLDESNIELVCANAKTEKPVEVPVRRTGAMDRRPPAQRKHPVA